MQSTVSYRNWMDYAPSPLQTPAVRMPAYGGGHSKVKETKPVRMASPTPSARMPTVPAMKPSMRPAKWRTLPNAVANFDSYMSAVPNLDKLRRDFLAGNMSPSLTTKGLQRRAIVKDQAATYELVVDVSDYNPDEVKVEVVKGGAAVLVKGAHNSASKPGLSQSNAEKRGSKSSSNPAKKSETRSFTEKYSFPAEVDKESINWRLTRGQLVISANKSQTWNHSPMSMHGRHSHHSHHAHQH